MSSCVVAVPLCIVLLVVLYDSDEDDDVEKREIREELVRRGGDCNVFMFCKLGFFFFKRLPTLVLKFICYRLFA